VHAPMRDTISKTDDANTVKKLAQTQQYKK